MNVNYTAKLAATSLPEIERAARRRWGLFIGAGEGVEVELPWNASVTYNADLGEATLSVTTASEDSKSKPAS